MCLKLQSKMQLNFLIYNNFCKRKKPQSKLWRLVLGLCFPSQLPSCAFIRGSQRWLSARHVTSKCLLYGLVHLTVTVRSIYGTLPIEFKERAHS